MSVKEVLQALGNWGITLKPETPREIVRQIEQNKFGHIAILPGRINPLQYGDGLLREARYVGVYRSTFKQSDDTLEIKGVGMNFWLGDEDDKGDIFETPVVLTGVTFPNAIRALLPASGSVIEGNLYSVPGAGTYTNKHQWETPRKAIQYVTDTYTTSAEFTGIDRIVEYRVNGDATLDAGPIENLYSTTPKAILVKKDTGRDMRMLGLRADMSLDYDVEDLTTRVVLIAEGEGDTVSTGSADATPSGFKDLFGNPIKQTRIVSESGTTVGNATTRAQLQLIRWSLPRQAIQIHTDEFDIKGDFAVGDYIYVFDPESGFFDLDQETFWRGQPINPLALRVKEMDWGVRPNWTVAFRKNDGTWLDLSEYYKPEGGGSTLAVGDYRRTLAGNNYEPLSFRPNLPLPGTDATIPAAPAWDTFSTGSYQPENGEWTKAAVYASWFQPNNGDGSVITDGGHYEIRYRVNTYIGYQVRWGQLNTAGYRWGGLSGNKWGAPISDPVETSQEWHTVYVGWGQTQALIQELTPGVEYEFQIRAVDTANPAHQGPWSTSEFVLASEDLFAPDVPAAPVVASSRISIQVIHTLGKSSGGTYNLPPDLVYLSVHVGGSDSFLADETNMVGKLIANSGMIQANIPAIGTFQIEQTDDVWVKVIAVDRAGNKSGASNAVQASVDLIDDAHISDLTVSKVTAGTIMAQWIMAGSIKTAQDGARVELAAAGLKAYNSAGVETVSINSADGSALMTGKLQTAVNGDGITIEPGVTPKIRLTPNDVYDHYGRLLSFNDVVMGTVLDMSVRRSSDDAIDGGKVLLWENGAVLSHQPNAGTEQFIGVDYPVNGAIQVQAGKLEVHSPGSNELLFDNDTGNIEFWGKWPNNIYSDPKQALWTMGDSTAGTGPTTATYSYGPTMARTLWPVVSIKSSADSFVRLVTSGNTGFSVAFSAAVAHGINAWCVAM